MEDRPNVKAVRALELKRLEAMRKHNGQDSDEEDDVLDAMDDAWWALTEEEREYMNRTPGPHSAETIQWLDKAGA